MSSLSVNNTRQEVRRTMVKSRDEDGLKQSKLWIDPRPSYAVHAHLGDGKGIISQKSHRRTKVRYRYSGLHTITPRLAVSLSASETQQSSREVADGTPEQNCLMYHQHVNRSLEGSS